MSGLCERCVTREARSAHDLFCNECERQLRPIERDFLLRSAINSLALSNVIVSRAEAETILDDVLRGPLPVLVDNLADALARAEAAEARLAALEAAARAVIEQETYHYESGSLRACSRCGDRRMEHGHADGCAFGALAALLGEGAA
jgi:hypothetical protein